MRFSLSAQNLLSRSEGGRGLQVLACCSKRLLLQLRCLIKCLEAGVEGRLVHPIPWHGEFAAYILNTTFLPADGSIKLWDLRNLKQSLAAADGLPCSYHNTQVGERLHGTAHPFARVRMLRKDLLQEMEGTTLITHCAYDRERVQQLNPRAVLLLAAPTPPQCCFSPDEKQVLTGTSAEGKDSSGALVVLSADTLDKVGEVDVDGSAVSMQVSL